MSINTADHLTGPRHAGSAKAVGRYLGLLLLAQILLAGPVYTAPGMLRPVMDRDFLASAAADAMQIRLAVLLLFVLGSLTFAMALTAMPVIRRNSERMAHLFLGLALVGLGTQAIEAVAIRNMVSMSVMYATAAAPAEMLETVGAVVRSGWLSAHFTNLLVGHITMFTLFIIVYRFALVPRALGAVGIATTTLSVTAVTSTLLGNPFSYWMVMPAGLTVIALALWLIVKGLIESDPRH